MIGEDPLLGATPHPGETEFRVWAPEARFVEVLVERKGVFGLPPEPAGYFSGVVPVLIELLQPDGARSDLAHAEAPSNGRIDLDIPIAFDDPVGTWTLRSRELATGRAAEARFAVR